MVPYKIPYVTPLYGVQTIAHMDARDIRKGDLEFSSFGLEDGAAEMQYCQPSTRILQLFTGLLFWKLVFCTILGKPD